MKGISFIFLISPFYIVITNKCICNLIQNKLISQKPELTDYPTIKLIFKNTIFNIRILTVINWLINLFNII